MIERKNTIFAIRNVMIHKTHRTGFQTKSTLKKALEIVVKLGI